MVAIRGSRRKVAKRVAHSRLRRLDRLFSIFAQLHGPVANNEGTVAEESQRVAVDRTKRRSDAAWALQAWSRRQEDPELQPHLGKYVAIYNSKVIASGDDRTEVVARAVEATGISAEQLFTDFWDDADTFHSVTGE